MWAIVPSARSPKTKLSRPWRQANPVRGEILDVVDGCCGSIRREASSQVQKRWTGNGAIDEAVPDSSRSGHTVPVALEELIAERPENLPSDISKVV